MNDALFVLRTLRSKPGFALAAIGTLALGIGANTAMFGVVNAVFLRPLPYPNADRVVWATEYFPKFKRSMVFVPDYAAWVRASKAFERLAAMGTTIGVNFSSGKQAAERVQAGHVSTNFFATLGVQPRIGRDFIPGHEDEAIVSDALWRDYFHADPQIAGKHVVLDGKAATVVGVMPPGFLYPDAADTGVWMPDAIQPGATTPARHMRFVSVIGRLKPGVKLQEARSNLAWIARGMDREYSTPWSTYHAAAAVRVVSLQEQLTSGSRMAVKVLMAAVLFILLIVCANLANLFLARSLEREKEISIRMAIGASRGRIVRLLLTETMLFALIAGCAGLTILYWGNTALRFLVPAVVSSHIAVDWNVLGFTAICSILTGLLFGVLPALTASRAQPGPRSSRLRQGLVIAQLALSVVLLIGAGLLLRTFLLVLNVNPGFDPHNVMLADVSLAPVETYTPARQTEFFDRALANLQRIPGVERVAVTSASPLVPFNEVAAGLHAEGEPETSDTVVMTSSSADYFRLLGIPILEGRSFNDDDRPGRSRVAVLNRTLAGILFKDRDPIGHRVQIDTDSWVTVVGVVGDMRHRALDDKVWPELFQPYTQAPSAWMSVLIRTSVDPSGVAPVMRTAIRAVDPSQPVFDLQSMETRVSHSLSQRRERAFLIAAIAALAFIIAVIGVYGVVSYSALRRTHEIGIRVAVGANPTNILNLIVGEGLRIGIIGVGIGAGAALSLTRYLSSFLYGVNARDLATFGLVSLLLLAAATAASLIPAIRATRIDPLTALREQ